jgi:pilus assembly protein CpaD
MDPNLKTITRIFTVLFVCVAGGLVSGCLYTFHPTPAQHEPQPNLVEYRHDVEFAAERFSLSREQGQALEAFVARVGVGYGDRVYLATATPQGAKGESAVRLAQRRAESVSSFLGLNDVKIDALIDDYGDGSPLGDSVTVLVHRYLVALPACPDWTDRPGKKFMNQPANNWSCATAVNFGMMVADPGDLVRGREAGPGDGQMLADSVYRYRKGETKPLADDVSTAETFPGGSSSSTGSGSSSSSSSGSGN